MDDGPSIVIMVIQFLIDISNILLNVFIIYALRKLDKLSNISYWFIFFLSISDCLVGITGLAYDAHHALYCSSKQDSSSCRYVSELRTFFLAFSGRLTTVIAIDRSIRMKYLNRYNTIMTKMKANTILILNTILGLVQFIGDLASLGTIFQMAYGVLHIVCMCSSCIFYVFTYCSIKQRVAGMNFNIGHNDTVQTRDIEVQSNEVLHSSVCKNYCSGNNGNILSKRGEGECEKNDIITVKETSAQHNHCMNEIQEKTTVENLPNDRKLPLSSNSKQYDDDIDQETVGQRNITHLPSSTTYKDSSEIRNRGRRENEVGKAMLYIIMTVVVCYMPLFCRQFLSVWDISTGKIMEIISLWLVMANSSVNAIILIAFGREIRNLARSVFQKN